MTTLEGNIEVFRKDGGGFKLDDGEWYSFPYRKSNRDDAYRSQKGDRVKFQYTERGKYKNIDEGKFKVLASGPADTAAGGKQPSNPNASKVRWSLYEDPQFQQEQGARIGRSTALTQAVAWHSAALTNGQDPGGVLITAAQFADFIINGSVDQAKEEFEKEQAAEQQRQEAQQAADDFDDDIPF